MVALTPVRSLLLKVLSLDSGPIPNETCLTTLLTLHQARFPHDDNFLIERHGGNGDGVVTCLEESCFEDIALRQNLRDVNGGKQAGVGGLDAFWDHINSSAEHRAQRDQRVALHARMNPAPAAQPAQPAQPQQNKRSSSPAPDAHNKKAKQAHLPPLAHKPLSNLSNSSFDRAPVARPPPQQAAQPQPQSQAAARQSHALELSLKRSSLQKQVTNTEARLIGLRASGSKDFDEIDALNKSLINSRAQLAQVEKEIAIVGGVDGAAAGRAEDGVGMGMSGADKNRLFNNPNPKPNNVGASGSGAGRLVDVVGGGLPGMGLAEDDDDDVLLRGLGMPVGRSTEDLNDFLVAAAEGSDFEGNHSVDTAAKALGLASQKDCVGSMVIPLMPHQLIGVAWMVEREKSKHFGGILGDEMGLGKTVQTIALMAKQESGDPAEKTTLIIAPLALLSQWKEEIQSKMKDSYWRILVHHGATKVRTAKELMKYDVVLTTYHTLAGEWPDEEGAVKKAKKGKKKAAALNGFVDEDDDDDFVRVKKMGPLFEAGFFRIVLDEAQNVRNRATKISRAVAQLDTLFRWCLTGTPITNSLGDLFPLLRFLQIKPWFSYSDFSEHIMKYEKKRPDIAGKRAQTILSTCMCRRKKDSKLDGKELITLPTKTVELQVLEFSQEERDIYSFVEGKSQQTFNKYLRQGTVLKNYASVLVMLLRLRQLCLHPCLISDGFDALAKDAENEEKNATELERAEKSLGETKVAKIRKARFTVVAERIKAEKESADAAIEGDDCPICFDPLMDAKGGAKVTACCHFFCGECVEDVLDQPAMDEDVNDADAVKYKKDERPCPSCRQPISKRLLFDMAAFEPTDAELDELMGDMDVDIEDDEERSDDEDEAEASEEEDLPLFANASKQKNRKVVVDSDDEEEMNEKEDAKRKEKDEKKKAKAKARELPVWMQEQEPSTKMKWVLGEIQRVDEEHPDDKFLIISQFTSALDLVDEYLDKNGFKVTRFQGDMSADQRAESVAILAKSKKCKIMLMSLKCGGVGLNLVRANRVINLDLGWSHAVEAQAFDRCHRIGQTKEVFVNRLTIENTVENRIALLQDKKKVLSDASLGEGAGGKLGKLSVADLANLFGLRLNGDRINDD